MSCDIDYKEKFDYIYRETKFSSEKEKRKEKSASDKYYHNVLE